MNDFNQKEKILYFVIEILLRQNIEEQFYQYLETNCERSIEQIAKKYQNDYLKLIQFYQKILYSDDQLVLEYNLFIRHYHDSILRLIKSEIIRNIQKNIDFHENNCQMIIQNYFESNNEMTIKLFKEIEYFFNSENQLQKILLRFILSTFAKIFKQEEIWKDFQKVIAIAMKIKD